VVVARARGGGAMTWKGVSSSSDLVCLKGDELAVARVLFTCWSGKKCGSLEILGAEAEGGGSMDVIVVTGLELVENVFALRFVAIAAAS